MEQHLFIIILEQQSYIRIYVIWITRIGSTQPRVVYYWKTSEVKERKLKIHYERENKENQSNNVIKQRNIMKKTAQKEERLKKIIKEVKIINKIIIQINNHSRVVWNSKLKFFSVSQLLGLALWLLFGSDSSPFTAPGLIVSLQEKRKKERKKEREREREREKWRKRDGGRKGGRKKGRKTDRPPADFKPAKQVLLVLLYATGWRGLGFSFLFSDGFVRMGPWSGSHSSQLPSLQPNSSDSCQVHRSLLCQARGFSPPAVMSLRSTS